jgi:hypothetical protein
MSTYRNPIAHSADPESSHAAAREVTDSGARDTHCAVVLDAVKAHPGLTSAELVEHVGHGLDLTETRRRLCDLKLAALVVREKPRVCSISKRKVETWRAVERRVREVRDVQAELFG